MTDARAFWVTGRNQGEIRTESLQSPSEGDVLVDTRYSGVSRGTELLVYGGHVPPSEHARMRAPYQSGEFPWPVKYGYSSVGRVARGAAHLVGRSVACLFPHQTAYVVPEGAVVLVPEGVPERRAVLGPSVETALNVVWDAEVKAGDRVAVVGAGVIGASVAYLAARHPGTEIELVDVDPAKAHLAAALGVGFKLPADARREADVVVHASGAPGGLLTALSLAGEGATVVEASWFGDRGVSLPLGEAFHRRRLRIQSSQVGQIPRAQSSRWTTRRRFEAALRLLQDPAFDVLVSGESSFEELPETMNRFSAGESGLCHRITYY
jgi:2-desacetyl-2-hydroxyethyl bacteriochlorophyllide A dehydrogenase